ncbi:glycine N-acyltransferase-like [Nerophis ophidion]|uniref:glycine N-acyltransferase-like n=1 Tax=Nerophis ophidion TaxID=159077 RepID=UPI002AE057BC|nr:glycine N-acyltransferase-like [Nerophis ophidion]
MKILKACTDLLLMKTILSRELPQSVYVLGGLCHILGGNTFQLKMCVDSWPTFSTAVCYRQNQDLGSGSSLGDLPDVYSVFSKNVYSVFSKNQDSLRRLLANDNVFKWGKNLEFKVESCHHEILKEITPLRGLRDASGGSLVYIHHSPDTFPSCASEPEIGTLSECHAELVVAHLPYVSNRRYVHQVRRYIKHLPSYCVLDRKKQPASWLLTDEFNELRMAYTRPEYRHAGLQRHLFARMVRERISAGIPVYSGTHKDNEAANKGALAFGMTPGVKTLCLFTSDDGV